LCHEAKFRFLLVISRFICILKVYIMHIKCIHLKCRMPALHWIGKERVVSHHQDVPFRVLEHSYGFTEGREQKALTGSGNKIIHRDNIEDLIGLVTEYEGKIKFSYIDPTYKTGNEGWVYNDNDNHPKIKKWLKEIV